MKITDSVSWLTIVYLFLSVIFSSLYFVEKADNHDLEQRYHQCSGRYY